MQSQPPYKLTATPQGIFLNGEPLNKNIIDALPARSLRHLMHACELMPKMTPKDWEPSAPHGPNDIPQSALFEMHLAMANAGLLNKFNFNPDELRDAWGRWIAAAVGSIIPSADAAEQPADSGKESRNRKAISATVENHTVIITNDDGSKEVRSGGSRPWRNNNPGDLKFKTIGHPSIGWDGDFAIFPSEQAGVDAAIARFHRPKYWTKTLFEAIEVWAPKEDGNDPEGITKDVSKWTGISADTPINTLTPDQLRSLVLAMARREGSWVKGKVTIIETK